jgi:hypothetical protein
MTETECIYSSRTAPREEWKLGHSSSQQTWLSSEDFRAEKISEQCKADGTRRGCSLFVKLRLLYFNGNHSMHNLFLQMAQETEECLFMPRSIQENLFQ